MHVLGMCFMVFTEKLYFEFSFKIGTGVQLSHWPHNLLENAPDAPSRACLLAASAVEFD